ncbi:MAG: hypothetical protein ISR78_07305 [Spirochaetia bacterium]|nr:hypothetical protein [Spirochaetia bacterium]
MKRINYVKTALIFCLLLLIGSVVLSAAELETYITAAQENSISGRLNDLQRTVSTLQWERSGLEEPEEKGVSVSAGGGTLSYAQDQTGDDIVALEPSASVTFHDLDLTITLTAPTTLNATDTVFSSSPKVSIQKTLETYTLEEDTTLEDIESAAEKMAIDRNYYAGLIAVEKSVVQSIKELITLDKSLFITENSIADAELSLNNDIETGQLKEGSTAWKLRNNSITRLENTLSTTQNTLSAARDHFKTITGMDYEAVTSEDIPQSDLALQVPDFGNTKVLLAAMDVEIARQRVSDELSTRESNEISDSSFTYLVNGSYKAGLNQPAGNYDHTLQAGVTASNSEFVIEAGVSTVISSTGITPSAYITGRWADKPDDWKEFDELTISILENQATAAEQSYNQSYSDYLNDIQTMQLRISSWNNSRTELELTYSELTMLLDDARYAYAKGFGSESEVQDAQNDLQTAAYELLLHSLDGLLIEQDIRTLQL